MSDKPEKMLIEVFLNWEEFPDETELIHNILEHGNLSSFLYVVMQDINTGMYNIEESHRQRVLDGIIETVTTIYDAMSGIDTNVVGLVETVNEIVSNPSTLIKTKEGKENEEKPKLDTEQIEVEELQIEIDEGVNDKEELDLTGMEDIFLM